MVNASLFCGVTVSMILFVVDSILWIMNVCILSWCSILTDKKILRVGCSGIKLGWLSQKDEPHKMDDLGKFDETVSIITSRFVGPG